METNCSPTTRTLNIDGMSSEACVQQVAAALRQTRGVAIRSIRVGSAVIEADDRGARHARRSLDAVGFAARDTSMSRAYRPYLASDVASPAAAGGGNAEAWRTSANAGMSANEPVREDQRERVPQLQKARIQTAVA